MNNVELEKLSRQLDSENVRDRILSLIRLRNVPANDSVPLVKKVLHDEILAVRSLAIATLGMRPNQESYLLLVQLLESDIDPGIRANAAAALGDFQEKRVLEPLVRAFYEDTNWLVRFSAAVALGNLKDTRAKDVLIEALQEEDLMLQQGAIAALGEIGAINALEDILEFVRSEDWLIRRQVAQALGNLPDPKSTSALKYLAKDSHPQVRQAAEIALNL